MHTRLRADLASTFFDLAPARLRRFRRRHGLPPGAIAADVYATELLDEPRATLGDPQPVAGHVG